MADSYTGNEKGEMRQGFLVSSEQHGMSDDIHANMVFGNAPLTAFEDLQSLLVGQDAQLLLGCFEVTVSGKDHLEGEFARTALEVAVTSLLQKEPVQQVELFRVRLEEGRGFVEEP